MSGIVLELRDVVMILLGIGTPVAVYVGMRERMVKMETKIDTLTATVEKQANAREVHSESLGEVREELAGLRQRVVALENGRTSTGSFALSADTTGPHKPTR